MHRATLKMVGTRTLHHSGSFVWVHAFSRVGRESPVRTEPLPTALSIAQCLEQILLVLVVVLVLGLLWVSTAARGPALSKRQRVEG
jgi:hypothetical protein